MKAIKVSIVDTKCVTRRFLLCFRAQQILTVRTTRIYDVQAIDLLGSRRCLSYVSGQTLHWALWILGFEPADVIWQGVNVSTVWQDSDVFPDVILVKGLL